MSVRDLAVCCALLVVAGVLACPVVALGAVQTYRVEAVELPSVPPYAGGTLGNLGVNDTGLMTVAFCDADGLRHSAIVQKGRWTIIDVPGSVQTGAAHPNNLGQVPLSYDNGDGIWHGAIYWRGKYTRIPDIAGFSLGCLTGINDFGVFCGYGANEGDGLVGLFGTASKQTLFTYPDGAVATGALGINDWGILVGVTIESPGGRHAFQYNTWTGQGTDLIPAPWSEYLSYSAYANAINNLGDMLLCGQPGVLHPNGTWASIPFPEGTVCCVWPGSAFINDLGQVSGVYVGCGGVDHAYGYYGFLATPVYSKK